MLPDYSTYDNVDAAYFDFTDIVTKVINEIVPFLKTCVKTIPVSGLVMKKKSRLHTDGVNFRRARIRLQTMIKNKKRNFISNKFTENIAKPKELWKTQSQLGLPSKQKATSKICLKENGEVKFEPKSNCTIFK